MLATMYSLPINGHQMLATMYGLPGNDHLILATKCRLPINDHLILATKCRLPSHNAYLIIVAKYWTTTGVCCVMDRQPVSVGVVLRMAEQSDLNTDNLLPCVVTLHLSAIAGNVILSLLLQGWCF